MKETREDKQVRGFLSESFTYKDLTFKPLTVRTLILLERVKSPYFSGGDQMRGLMDLLFISSSDSKTIMKIINNDEYEIGLMDFAEQFSAEDLNDLGAIIEQNNEAVASTLVEVIEKSNEPKKKTVPSLTGSPT